MARRGEVAAVYAAGIAQGIALVTFPAASAIFTSSAHYGLTSGEYGAMFVPQAITAVAASLLGAGLSQRLGVRRIYLLGLAANLLSMGLLVLSQVAMSDRALAYGLLLGATACLGTGFGLTVPAVNTFAAFFFPRSVDSAVLVLNALLGLGTALAPAFGALFVGLGIWWGLPVLVAALLAVLLGISAALPLEARAASSGARAPFPRRFWLFAGFAVLYGIVETINGNWGTLYMARSLGASAELATIALTVFWATVTAGRVLFAAVERWLPPRLVYRGLPFVAAVALALTASLPRGEPSLGLLAFALAGLGCSALLPLTISFGEDEMTAIAASVAGGLIAAYQVGYGIAAFGVGHLPDLAGHGLGATFALGAVVAAAMGALSFRVAGGAPPASPPRRP